MYLVSMDVTRAPEGADEEEWARKQEAAVEMINFWLSEEDAVAATIGSGGTQEVMIRVKGGYDPDLIVVQAGRPVRLLFNRQETASCSEMVQFPDFGVSRQLPAGETGEVVVSGWTEGTGLDPAAAATRYEELGAAGILFTDVDVEGRLEGVRTEPVRRVVEAVEVPVVASGGVATVEDVQALEAAGADAVVVGSALYEGAFTLEEAMNST
jgi:pyridoxal biosynthesis lyase PdxS